MTAFSKILLCAILVLILFSASPGYAKKITVDVANANVDPEEQTGVPIYLVNEVDTVVAFALWMVVDRPDLIGFKAHANEILDTTGTLIGEYGFDLYFNVVTPTVFAFAGLPNSPSSEIPVQIGTIPFVKVNVVANDILDTATERTAEVIILDNMTSTFQWVDNHGETIGILTDTLPDSSCFHCEVWDGDICLSWVQISCASPDVDSIWCCDTVYQNYLDTAYYDLRSGFVTVNYLFLCGDFNDDNQTNMLDVVHYINCLYTLPPGSCDYSQMDIDCTGDTNILDVTRYINYLYQSGPPLECCE